MSMQAPDSRNATIETYRFGARQQVFRGPPPDLSGRYVAFLGDSHTFARFCPHPYPVLIGDTIGMTTANFGADGAGPGFFLGADAVLDAAALADVCVVQVMGARALTNRMYSVRPRRNERLHAVTDLLAGIYPEVEFSRFTTVRALLHRLFEVDEDRFAMIENELKNAWIGRVQTLLAEIECPTILLWFSAREPEVCALDASMADLVAAPAFVDRAMIDAVSGNTDAVVEVVGTDGLPQDLTRDGTPVLFKPSGQPIVENTTLPSPKMHRICADALVPEIGRLLAGHRR